MHEVLSHWSKEYHILIEEFVKIYHKIDSRLINDVISHISEIQTFVVLLKVVKKGNQSIEYNGDLANNDSKEFKEFAKTAKEGVRISKKCI